MTIIPPAPGSVCRALSRQAGVRAALVLVVAQASSTITRVRLLTNEHEMATDADALLDPCMSVRPYLLLAHDFPGYVRSRDLGPALSVIDPERDLRVPFTLPLTGRRDPRWQWKAAELERMQALQPPLAEILGE